MEMNNEAQTNLFPLDARLFFELLSPAGVQSLAVVDSSRAYFSY
jgi:hypothetical protein